MCIPRGRIERAGSQSPAQVWDRMDSVRVHPEVLVCFCPQHVQSSHLLLTKEAEDQEVFMTLKDAGKGCKDRELK
jgi:hypothetical protein